MTGMNFFSGSSLPGIIMHIGHNPSRTTAVSIEDVEFEHCVFGGGEYRVPNPALSGGGRIAGVKLGVRAITSLPQSLRYSYVARMIAFLATPSMLLL